MIKKAMEYLMDLKPVEILKINGFTYVSRGESIQMIKKPQPRAIEMTTLTGLVDYIKENIDSLKVNNLVVHVEGPKKVSLCSELRADAERECYVECEALTPNITFDRFIDTEQFNIMLQSSFEDNLTRENLLKLTGNITENTVNKTSDNGISQSVTIKTGIAEVAEVEVPNPVTLKPYRTFSEIEQPESQFIFRMKAGHEAPQGALFEADGGAWRNEAMSNIKKYLEKELENQEHIKVIS